MEPPRWGRWQRENSDTHHLGKKDPYLMHGMAIESVNFLEKGSLYTLQEAGHWVQHDEWEEFNRLMLEHLLM
ncbi:hypothetical protein GCM10028895_10560 [Pontibacter rugosus]